MGTYELATIPNDKRLQIPLPVCRELTWIKHEKGQKIECFWIAGPSGGVQIFPISGGLDKQRGELAKAIDPVPFDFDSDAEWVELLRLYSASRPIQLTRNGEHFRLYVPAEAEELGLITSQPEKELAVFCAGEILELWDKSQWQQHISQVAKNRTAIHQRSQQALKTRKATYKKN